MTASVGARRDGLTVTSDIRAGLTVRSATWSDIAGAVNWTLGRGAQVVPAHSPMTRLEAGSEYTLSYRCKTRYQCVGRVWYLGLRAFASAAATNVEVKIPSTAAATTVYVRGGRATIVPFQFLEKGVTQSYSEQTVTITIKAISADVVLDHVSAFDAPRPTLATTQATVSGSDLGTDLALLRPRQPIAAARLDNLTEALANPSLIGRRSSLLQWCVPYLNDGVATTTYAATCITATFSGFALFGLGLPILSRYLTATTAAVKCSFLAWKTGTATGQVRLSSSSNGAGTAVSITSGATTPAWRTSVAATIDAEDMTTTTGLRSGAMDLVNVQARRTSGSGIIYIAGCGVWEE